MAEVAAAPYSIFQLRRRRGVIRASVTRLGNRLRELKDIIDQPTTPAHARQLDAKLKDLDSNFKDLHMQVVDQPEGEEALEAEQAILDKHDDDVASFPVRVQRLVNSGSTTPPDTHVRERRSLSLKMSRLERGLRDTDEAVTAIPEEAEDFAVDQKHQEQLSDYKKDHATLYDNIVALDPEEEDALLTEHSVLERSLFDCSRS